MLTPCLTAFVSNDTDAASANSNLQITSAKNSEEKHSISNEKCESAIFDDSAIYEEGKRINQDANIEANEKAKSFPIDYDNMVYDTSSTFIQK